MGTTELALARAGLPGRPDPVLPALEIDLLRALVAVIDQGGFTAAAERLNLTQSAVSMQLKRLEDRLDRRLVERDRRGVRPTADGEVLIGYARRMLALNDEAVLRLLDAGAPRPGPDRRARRLCQRLPAADHRPFRSRQPQGRDRGPLRPLTRAGGRACPGRP